jgi:hypothetical protein
MVAEAAQAGRSAYAGLLAEARASPVLHVDETGWRQNGRNGYIWSVSTPAVRYFHFASSRAGHVARRLIGEDYEGVVVSDFYTAYDQFDGLHQRCWAHLLRDIHELTSQQPDDVELGAWAEQVHTLYGQAIAAVPRVAALPSAQRTIQQQAYEAALLTLCRAQPEQAAQATLCTRIARYLPELFRFVADAAVPATNNAAERALRPLVVARKISGGSRSARGSKTRMILQSLIATWELRGQDPVAALLPLLQAPHDSPSKLPSV